MIPAPVLTVMTILAAVLAGLEQAPIPAPWSTIVKVIAVAVAAFIARSQVVPTSKAVALVATALKTETPIDPVASARKMVASKPPPPILPLLCLALLGCSAAPVITSVAEATCIAVTDAEFPAAEPLCVYGDEIAIAIEQYIQTHGGTAPAMQTNQTTGVTTVPHDLFDQLAQRPGLKARKVTKCPKLPAGTVAP